MKNWKEVAMEIDFLVVMSLFGLHCNSCISINPFHPQMITPFAHIPEF